MRVTANDLLRAGWHREWSWVNGVAITVWAFRHNPNPGSRLTFHEAVRAYKGGMRDEV